MSIEERQAKAQEKLRQAKAELRQIQAQNHVLERKLYDDAYGVRIETL